MNHRVPVGPEPPASGRYRLAFYEAIWIRPRYEARASCKAEKPAR
jgi:hypothetical protein